MEKNKKENKTNIIISSTLVLFAIIFTILVKFVSVGKAGDSLTEVGFSSLNDAFFEATKVNETAYTISTILGYMVLALVVLYFVLAIRQMLITKKIHSFWWALAVFYFVVFILYLLFNKFAINYRPITIDGKLESSYPSSHTLLALCVCFSSLIMNRKLYKDVNYIKIANLAIIVISIAMVILRLLSGYHWLTDIIGGIIISFALSACLYTAIEILDRKNEDKKQE